MAIARAAKRAQRRKTQSENRQAQEAMIGKIEQLLLPSTEKDSDPSSSNRPSGH